MRDQKITLTARFIKHGKYEVKGVILNAKDEVDAVRKYCRKKKPCEIEGIRC